MAKEAKQKATPVSQRAVERIRVALDTALADPAKAAADAAAEGAKLPSNIVGLLDQVLAAVPSYRDMSIIQLAFGLEDAAAAVDLTIRPPGARSAGAKVGSLFKTRHIAAVADAYQNIGKNVEKLDRGNVPASDETLRWATTASRSDHEAAFGYLIAKVSLTARAVLPQPDLDQAKLTFHACAVLLHALLNIPSAGAYQQFACAAFLEALIDEFGQGGANGLRVDTKKLNASDASSKVNGDIQVLRGRRLEEAFEVTANPWRTKVATALAAGKQADLQRVHIIADVEAGFPENSGELAVEGVDLTVIDVHAYLRTLMAIMRKPARASALVRLYQLLDRNQPDIERTNAYVRLLRAHKLTTT